MEGYQGKHDRDFMAEVTCQLDFERWVGFGPRRWQRHSRQGEQLKQRHRGRNGRGLYKKPGKVQSGQMRRLQTGTQWTTSGPQTCSVWPTRTGLHSVLEKGAIHL